VEMCSCSEIYRYVNSFIVCKLLLFRIGWRSRRHYSAQSSRIRGSRTRQWYFSSTRKTCSRKRSPTRIS